MPRRRVALPLLAAVLWACAAELAGVRANPDADSSEYAHDADAEGASVEYAVHDAGFLEVDGAAGLSVGADFEDDWRHNLPDGGSEGASEHFHCLACGGELEGELSAECAKARNDYVAATCSDAAAHAACAGGRGADSCTFVASDELGAVGGDSASDGGGDGAIESGASAACVDLVTAPCVGLDGAQQDAAAHFDWVDGVKQERPARFVSNPLAAVLRGQVPSFCFECHADIANPDMDAQWPPACERLMRDFQLAVCPMGPDRGFLEDEPYHACSPNCMDPIAGVGAAGASDAAEAQEPAFKRDKQCTAGFIAMCPSDPALHDDGLGGADWDLEGEPGSPGYDPSSLPDADGGATPDSGFRLPDPEPFAADPDAPRVGDPGAAAGGTFNWAEAAGSGPGPGAHGAEAVPSEMPAGGDSALGDIPREHEQGADGLAGVEAGQEHDGEHPAEWADGDPFADLEDVDMT